MIVRMMVLAIVFATSPLLAGEGKALHEKNCSRCHGTDVYTRETRGVKSLKGLKSRVKQCSLAAESKWTDDEVIMVADYLNKNFYKF